MAFILVLLELQLLGNLATAAPSIPDQRHVPGDVDATVVDLSAKEELAGWMRFPQTGEDFMEGDIKIPEQFRHFHSGQLGGPFEAAVDFNSYPTQQWPGNTVAYTISPVFLYEAAVVTVSSTEVFFAECSLLADTMAFILVLLELQLLLGNLATAAPSIPGDKEKTLQLILLTDQRHVPGDVDATVVDLSAKEELAGWMRFPQTGEDFMEGDIKIPEQFRHFHSGQLGGPFEAAVNFNSYPTQQWPGNTVAYTISPVF
ncbi:unnamed protein product [Cyprideis torosa]|uniref:Uncharacterized protein n=1 Tax=Cyprideis torosa TaxID=163714 RepID=A0A7R8WJA8_9CRUS|nr:unnamed protein product [Cyprideis torosa]CAG0901787.1 unnamed protein product [Cyprideis torosa]